MLKENSEEPILKTQDLYLWGTSAFLILAPVVAAYLIWIRPWDALVLDTYIQISIWLVIVVCLYLLLLVFWPITFMEGVTFVYEDRIVRQKRFRPEEVFYFSDLEGWFPNIDSRKNNIIDLRLYFKGDPDERLLMLNLTCNLQAFYDYLTENKFTRLEKDRLTLDGKSVTVIVTSLFLMLILFAGAYMCWHYGPILRDKDKGTEKVILSHLILSQKPFDSGASRGDYRMTFKTNEYRNVAFFSCSDSVRWYYQDAPASYDVAHDTISIEILKYDYDLKIAHTRQPTFLDKHFDWGRIHIEAIKFDAIRFRDFRIQTDPQWSTRR